MVEAGVIYTDSGGCKSEVQQRRLSVMRKGFVYVLTNRSMPGLVKVGYTMKVPTERAVELGTTGVPTPFQVEYYCLVEDPDQLETIVHQALVSSRTNIDREFFRIEVKDAIAAIERCSSKPEHAWHRVPAIPVRPPLVACKSCGASYAYAEFCPKCKQRLVW